MAKEQFALLAVNETDNWDQSILDKHGFEAAFGVYLIRLGEATHCCSLTASTWAEFYENAFIYDHEDAAADKAAEDLAHENGGEFGRYLTYVDPDQKSRYLGAAITVEVDADEFEGGKKSDAYHEAIWTEAREAAATGAISEPAILWSEEYYAQQEEYAAKRRAENRRPLARPILPLFFAAAQRDGFATYEGAIEHGWL